MNKFGTNQISIVNEMLRTEVEETQEFIKQANTFKGINFPSHQTTKHPQCPPKTNTPWSKNRKWRSSIYITSHPVPESPTRKKKNKVISTDSKTPPAISSWISLENMHQLMEREKEWKFGKIREGWWVGAEVERMKKWRVNNNNNNNSIWGLRRYFEKVGKWYLH